MLQVQTLGLPKGPQPTLISRGQNAVTIGWSFGGHGAATKSKKFEVQVRYRAKVKASNTGDDDDDSADTVSKAGAWSIANGVHQRSPIVVRGLQEGATYDISLRVRRMATQNRTTEPWGQFGTDLRGVSPASPPSTVQGVRLTAVRSSNMAIFWQVTSK